MWLGTCSSPLCTAVPTSPLQSNPRFGGFEHRHIEHLNMRRGGSSFGAWVHQSDIPTRWRRLEASCSSLAPALPSRGLHAISTRSHLALLDALLLARLGRRSLHGDLPTRLCDGRWLAPASRPAGSHFVGVTCFCHPFSLFHRRTHPSRHPSAAPVISANPPSSLPPASRRASESASNVTPPDTAQRISLGTRLYPREPWRPQRAAARRASSPQQLAMTKMQSAQYSLPPTTTLQHHPAAIPNISSQIVSP
ncbi:hypothetical protein L1887_47024 [Cichorium endivia]|nr:hypothetical protein L1887_47024 [Cichorium endivia]